VTLAIAFLQRIGKQLDEMRTVVLDVAHLETDGVMGERAARSWS
jgi:hypothetical protein